jgi:hypothetical protein
MIGRIRDHPFLLRTLVVVFAVGCATSPPVPREASPAEVLLPPKARTVDAIDPAAADRLLALDCAAITEVDVHDTLARVPAPRIVLLHGGIFPVHLVMVSFGRFLTGMGYPEAAIRHPGDRRWSHSPYEDSKQIAGLLAWYYERDALRPMMIGHSQGGVQAVKVLYELAGRIGEPIRVWNPLSDSAEDRTSIVDPLTGEARPVVGLSVSYVSVVGAGGAALLLPNQWSMVTRLRSIPDTVDDFTGYAIELDLFAWTLPGVPGTREYRANGTAKVRNVVLPASANHVLLPLTQDLAREGATRDWINAYNRDQPATSVPPADSPDGTLWAADVWHSVKQHWCLETQQLIRASRGRRKG